MRALALTVVLTGCLPSADLDELDRMAASLTPGDARMAGRMPVVDDFERPVTRNEMAVEEGEIGLGVHATDADWVMLAGGIELHPDELPLDAWTRIAETDHWIYACTGPSDGVVWFEQQPDLVDVRRTEVEGPDGEPVQELAVVAWFAGWGVVGANAPLQADVDVLPEEE